MINNILLVIAIFNIILSIIIIILSSIRRKKKDGSLLYLQATYNPIIGFDGKPYRILKIATDITESYNQQKEIEKRRR
jgi:PAS domain-containing protein